MRSARRALRELERHELANKAEPPINLVPMIDILTVLVLYLLVGSIFRHFTVLTLNMPNTAPVQMEEKPPLELTVTVRAGALDVSDRLGALQSLANVNGAYDLTALTALLVQIKQKAPDETAINLLLEPDIEYDVLVHVIDAVRLWPDGVPLPAGIPKPAIGSAAGLFPAIAIGDAPKPDGQP